MDAANKEEVKTSETHSDVDDDAKTSEKESVSATVSDDENCNEKIAAVSDAADVSTVETSTPPAEEIQSSEPPTSSASTSANSTVAPNFDIASFDDFLAKFLDTDSSKLDDHEIRAFAVTIPKTFILTEDRYQT
uniref:Uncharacterized protein n=1 Tax=Panagrolaimus sp. ES5 TaxID=591445 RepID=A0AC34GH76_9BILA